MRKYITFLLLLIFIFLPLSHSYGQEKMSLITYGPQAPTREGDDDFRQVIYLQFSKKISQKLYLRIFDADVGGRLDPIFEKWNTETKFQFFGGQGTYATPTAKKTYINKKDLYAGTLIASETFGVNPFRDNKWYNFATFSADMGEEIDGKYYLKLVVEGLKGDDGNTFDIAVSLDDKRNVQPEGLKIFSYAPTTRLPRKGVFAEMRFFVPEKVGNITVHNFDLAGAKVSVGTAFRSGIPVTSSGQNVWAKSKIALKEKEKNRIAALAYQGGGELPNDATFYITDDKGRNIPIELPIYVHKPNNRPIPRYKLEFVSDCQTVVFDASKSSDADGDTLKFLWDFGDGVTSKGVRTVHNYEKLGQYTVELVVSDDSGTVGNSSFKAFPVIINSAPKADAGFDIVSSPGEKTAFDGSKSKDDDGKIVRYLWNFGDGTKGKGVKVGHKYKRSGRYMVSLRVEDNSKSPCNFDTDKREVWINNSPIVEIGADRIAAVGQSITLDGSRSYDSDGEIVDYQWDFGDGSKGKEMIVNHSYSRPGKYVVKLKVSDNANVSNSYAVDKLNIIVNDRLVAKAGKDRGISVGEKTILNGAGSFDSDGQIISYKWDFGDGTKAEGKKVSHAYNKPGKYKVTLLVKDDSGSISDTAEDTLTIYVNNLPIAIAGEDVKTTASEVQFDGTASSDKDGKITAYRWDFGDATKGPERSLPKPLHLYKSPGTYSVKLTVTDDSGTSTNKNTDELKVVVNELPIADAGMNKISAPGETVNFDASQSLDPDGTVAKSVWDFGDGKTAEGIKVSHTYEKSGAYTVRLTVLDDTGHKEAADYDELKVFVNNPPVAVAGKDMLAATDQSVTFNGKGSYDLDGAIKSYIWQFSDKTTMQGVRVKRKFSKPGIYTANLTAIDNSGAKNASSQDKMLVHINHPPESRAGKDINICNSTILFNGSGSVDADGNSLTYLWDFGDGTPPVGGIKAVHTYKKSGTYPVILTVDDGTGLSNSKNSSSIAARINYPPVAKAGGSKTICAGDVVIFDGSDSSDPEGGLLKYFWDFGDGTSTEGQNPTKIYEDGGVYQAILTVKDDSGLMCDTDLDQAVIRVAESPVSIIGEDQIVCSNSVVQFDGSKSKDVDGVVNSFFWDFGDGKTGGGAKPSHVYTRADTYRVTLTITGDQIGECNNTDTDELIVTVKEAGIAKFKNLSIVPLGEKIEFDASESGGKGSKIVSYLWDFGDKSTGKGKKISHAYSKPGKYLVKLVVNTDAESECNTVSARNLITVNDKPVAEAGENKFVGVNEVTKFDASASRDSDGSIISYEWDFGDGEKASGIVVRHFYKKSGTYKIKLRITDDTKLKNNWDTDSLTVMVNKDPKAAIKAQEWACIDEGILFSGEGSEDPDGNIESYAWDFGDGSYAKGQKVSHKYKISGKYNITLKVDDGSKVTNSQATSAKTISINHPPEAYLEHIQMACPDKKVLFDASGSTDRDGKVVVFNWDFGDGSKAKGKKVSHAYKKPGRYDIKLGIIDNSGTGCSKAATASSIVVNTPPVATAGPDMGAFVGGAHDTVYFDGTRSYDPDGGPLTYLWNFGDGRSAYGAKVSHNYLKPGDYKVRLRVRDSSNKPCGEVYDQLIVRVRKRGEPKLTPKKKRRKKTKKI